MIPPIGPRGKPLGAGPLGAGVLRRDGKATTPLARKMV
jgi:hypothetical protein